jgi:hypothetical protein
MTAREPLTGEERELAARLAEWNVGVPSPAIEQAVLAHARTAQPVARATVGRRPPWLVGLASAAVLTLAVGIVWRVLESPPDTLVLMDTGPMSAPVPAESQVDGASLPFNDAAAPMPPPPAPSVSPAPAPAAPVASAPTPPASMSRTQSSEVTRSAPSAPLDRATRSQVAESARQSAATASPPPVAAPAGANSARRSASTPPAPQERGPASASAPMSAEARAKAGVPVSPAEPPRRLQTPPPAPSAPSGRPPAPPASPAPSAPPVAAPVPSPLPEFAPDPHVSREGESALGQSAGDAASGGDAKREDVLFNEDVARIRTLVQRGERTEALRALAQLQKRFPEWPLPADLQSLQKQPTR